MSQTSEKSNAGESVKDALHNRVALVTGGNRGIGRAIALKLASQGLAVAICGRDSQSLAAVQSELATLCQRSIFQVCDLRDEEAVKRLYATVGEKLGAVDILVNNAGIYKTEPVRDHSLETWNEIIEVNLTGAMLTSRAVLPAMIEAGWGRVINISSISGKTGEIWGSAYSASKFGLIGLTQSLALEVAQYGITVNAVCPGWVHTDLAVKQLEDPNWCKLNSTTKEESLQNASFAVPQMRFIEPSEVAELVAYLAGDDARGITGQSINICGGLSLH